MKNLKFLLLVFVVVLINSCSDDGVSPVNETKRGQLISSTFLREYSIVELTAIASLFGYSIEINSPVKAYKIEYISESTAYNLFETAKYYFNSDTLVTPSFIPFMLNAYITESNDGRKIEDFFNPKYKDAVNKIITGTISKMASNNLLTNIPKDLMDSTFYHNFINDKPEEAKIKSFLIENSLINFNPKSNMVLYHGNYDLDVPSFNSFDAYNHYSKTNSNIELLRDNLVMTHDQYFFEFIDRAREYLK